MSGIITEYPQFFTATNLEWKTLLSPDEHKDIVVRIKDRLKLNSPNILSELLVNTKDRKYQLWERNPLSMAFLQKAGDYISEMGFFVCLLPGHEQYVHVAKPVQEEVVQYGPLLPVIRSSFDIIQVI